MQTYITTNERIADLRNMSGLTQKELCDKVDIPYSTLSRIERGEITNVSNDILIKLSNFFNVSTDYLLGLTNVKFRKNIELSELGLSNKALFAILSGNLNTELLSRIIEHPHFSTLLDSADAYFTDTTKAGIQSRNDIIGLATGGIRDFIKLHPEKRQECNRDIRHLNAEKIGGAEADLNKLRNIFMAMLKDIKADYGTEPQDMSQNIFQEQYEIIKAKRNEIKEERELTEDDMAKITTEMLIESGTLDMDKTEQQLFFELFKHMLKRKSGISNRK